MFKLSRGFFIGTAVGFVAGVIAAPVIAELAPKLRPMAKNAIKTGLLGLEKIKENIGLIYESFEDLTAEAKSEAATEQNTAASFEEFKKKAETLTEINA